MKKLVVGAAVLALTLVLAACGGSGGQNSVSGSTTAGSGSDSPFPELHWASPPVTRADPVTYFSLATTSLVGPVEQTLMSYDKNGQLIPGVAESVENPNPTTYIYQLKKGEKFSDGKPVTGEDVLYSLQRNMAADSQTAPNFGSVKSISLEGADRIVFKLKKPDVTFPNVAAYSAQILQKEAALAGGEGKIGTSNNLPIGSGPYKFASFNPDKGATLVPNPFWSGEKPKAQKVTVTFVKDDSALALAMRSGEVDGDFFVESKRSFEFPGISTVGTEGVGQMAIGMNTLVAPLDDVHVRKAIAYATDREGMAQALFDGNVKIANTLTPASLFANIAPAQEVEDMFEALPKYEFDLAKAEAEMAKSKYPDGATISLAAEPGSIKIGQILQPELEKIGLHLKVEQMSESKFIEILFGPRDKLSLTIDPYGSTYPDPSALLNFFLSPEQATLNGLNSANYKNATVTDLLEEQNQTADGSKRLQLIGDIYEQTAKDVPYVPLFTPETFMVLSEGFAIQYFSQWTAKFGAWPLLVSQAS
jgi:peptide/nickel transport system substrate-binding protein